MKPLLTTVDAALFDLDGTLVETNIDFPLMRQKMLALAADSGVSTRRLESLDILAIVEAACESLTSVQKHDESDVLRTAAMRILEEIELAHARGTLEIPFARELVSGLRSRGVKVGIVTRNCRKASEISLDIVRIKPDVLICREDTNRHKPHPDQLHIALDALGARAEASVMVGDHTIDIAGGKAAGVKTIGVLRPDRPGDFFDRFAPDFVARNLEEVLGAIIDTDS